MTVGSVTIRGREMNHPLLGPGIYAVCPVCSGGDLVLDTKRCIIECLACGRKWRQV